MAHAAREVAVVLEEAQVKEDGSEWGHRSTCTPTPVQILSPGLAWPRPQEAWKPKRKSVASSLEPPGH